MDVTAYLLEPIIAFGVLAAIYSVLVFNSSGRKKNGHYSLPDWNFFLKKWWAFHVLKKWKKSRENEEIKLEPATDEPLKLDDDTCDTQEIFGTNRDGYTLLIKFTRKSHRISDLILILTLSDGTTFHLPNEHDTMIYDGSSETWRAEGLSLVLLEPFMRWRIIFNGMLRKRSNIGDNNLQHVKFNFIWIAASDPIRTPDDSSNNLMAEAIATEQWKDPNWAHGITQSPKRGYEQYGSMCGTVTMNNKEEALSNSIYGVRLRRWEPEKVLLSRSLTIYGAGFDGAAYYIGVESFRKGLTQVKFGSIRLPNGNVEPIDAIDIDLSTIGEDDMDLPKSFSIKLSSQSMNLMLFISLQNNLSRSFKNRNWENIIVPFQAGLNGYQGSGVLQLGYPNTDDVSREEHNITVKQLKWLSLEDLNSTIPFCVSFKERASHCPDAVGGKGASLGLLTSVATNKYKIPKGFCITAHALESHLKHYPEIQEAIQKIEHVNTNYSESALKDACQRVTALFISTPIHNLVKEHIICSFDSLCDSETDNLITKDLYYAVRSSGIGEDSEELSAAGQNATILGCHSVEDVLLGVQKCWSSLFTFQSVEYRRQHGQPVQCGMGVVVQVMVDARAAGVMFTRHPNTGDPSSIFITSNFGLGESVVSGQVDPDTIIIERDIHDNIKIKKVDIGKKGQRIVLQKMPSTEDSGTKTLETDDHEACTLSISEQECLLLGEIAIYQEKLWGLPRDIEWAIVQDRIYLLQARPITSLNSWSEFELAHELDSAVMSEDDLLTFANTGEVLPGCYSPLANSVVSKHIDDSLSEASSIPKTKYYIRGLTCTHHHVGLNMFNTLLKENEKTVTIRSKTMDLGIFGHIVTDNRMHSIGVHRNEPMGLKTQIKMFKDMIYVLWMSKSNSENSILLAKNFTIELSNKKTCLEVYNAIDECMIKLYKSSLYHSGCSSASVFSQIVFLTILLEGRSDFSMENYRDIGTILSSCTNVVSAEIPEMLHKLTIAIKSSGNVEGFCKQEPTNALKWLDMNCPNEYKLFTQFLDRHGHRCIREFDFLTDTWKIDPTPLIKLLQTTVKIPPKDEDTPSVKTTSDIIEELVSPISNTTKKVLKYVIPMCQRAVARREATKASFISCVNTMRMAYLELGKRMVMEWRLPDTKLIFFMTHSELGKYIKTRNPGYITKATLRRRFFPRWDKLQFSELVWGFAKPLTPALDDEMMKNCSNVKVAGTPVYFGKIIARACVIKSILEIDQLQSGDILITHSTDIGWSPYFPLIEGVVTELGGLISHGAVVAREYGLPCIVGAQGATSVFKTGDTVLLDAVSGILQKVETN